MFPEILRVVNEAYRQDLPVYGESASLDNPSKTDGWQVQRIHGGMNNALYRVERDGQVFACKLCVSDERRRAEREYAALELLQQRGLDLAPLPLGIDLSLAILPHPVVVYHWCEGQGLNSNGNEQNLSIISTALQKLHACLPEPQDSRRLSYPVQKAWFHWFEREPYMRELKGFMEKYAPWLRRISNEGQALAKRLERLVRISDDRLAGLPVALGWGAFPVSLCHVDPNSNNAILGADGRVRWVDWEYSGWGDPALDLAEYRWHIAYADLSESQQAGFRLAYQVPVDDPGFDRRLIFWDNLLAARWPLLLLRWLWSREHGPDRLRLSTIEAEKTDLWGRLVRLVERAEEFYSRPVRF